MPSDADPAYSSREGFDDEVDLSQTTRRTVMDPTGRGRGRSPSIRRSGNFISASAEGAQSNMALALAGKALRKKVRRRSVERRFGPAGRPLRR